MRQRVRSYDIVLSVVLIISIGLTIFLSYMLLREDDEKEVEITVDEVYFVVKAQTGERTRIEIKIFISNIGEKLRETKGEK